jgi:enterochelin esterase family protein
MPDYICVIQHAVKLPLLFRAAFHTIGVIDFFPGKTRSFQVTCMQVGSRSRLAVVTGFLLLMGGVCAFAQAPPAASSAPADGKPATCAGSGFLPAPATYKSVEQLPDGRVTFRICAPEAMSVRLNSNDIASVIPTAFGGGTPGLAMEKAPDGLWTVTTPKPIAPDNYRFFYNVDGVLMPDPQGTTYSPTRVSTTSTFEVTGEAGAFQAYDKDVPHGAVSQIEYWSKSLGVKRRAYVYTPPGYTKNGTRYPVLYLVHGAGDSDASWTTVGHAHYILDNLIAAGKAKPMIVIMPFGHTPERPGANLLANDDFADDFLKDLIPYVEASFRTINGPASRAMAGLSMGGAHTLNNGLTHPELFGYVGVFSMGLMNPQMVTDYETKNAVALKEAAKRMKLVYYAMGKTDFLYASVAPTRALLDKYGVKVVYHESEGGHEWINWRRYLQDFAPRLF